MFQGLYGFDKNIHQIPILAESYQANEFTFRLRSGISFHDGTPFNAEAVKVNLDRISNPENRLKRNSLFSTVAHTAVLDDSTVRIVLKTPFGAFVPTMAHPAAMMLSPKAIAQYGRDKSPSGRHRPVQVRELDRGHAETRAQRPILRARLAEAQQRDLP